MASTKEGFYYVEGRSLRAHIVLANMDAMDGMVGTRIHGSAAKFTRLWLGWMLRVWEQGLVAAALDRIKYPTHRAQCPKGLIILL